MSVIFSDTVAALRQLNESEGAVVQVRGYYEVGDGGGGRYVYREQAQEADNGGTIIAPSSGTGRWLLMNDDILTVEQFGAGGTQSAATNTQAFQNAASASPRLLCFRNVTYSVFPEITDNLQVLFDLSDEDGVIIDGRGAELKIEGEFSEGQSVFVFYLSRASNIMIRNLMLSGPEEAGPDKHTRGMLGFWHVNASQNIVIQNVKQIGGKIGVGCFRNALTEPLANSCKRIVVDNYETVGVAYPLSFQHSGDSVEVRNVRIRRCTRAYFPYGCRDHNVRMTVSDPRASPMVDLTVQTRKAKSAFLENIRCSVTIQDEDVDIESSWCGLVIQSFTDQIHRATIRNIRVEVNGVMTKNNKNIFSIQKKFDRQIDTVERGHIIEDVEISGNIVYRVSSNSSPIKAMWSDQGEWGAGEFVRALKFRDLRFTHRGFAKPPVCKLGVGSIEDLLVLENCHIPRGFSLSSPPRKGVRYVNTTVDRTFYPDMVVSVEKLTGNGQRRDIDLDHILTELETTAPTNFKLRNGKEGQEKQLVLFEAVGRAVVKPSKLWGHRTITFNKPGDAALLKFLNGRWTILSAQGCTLA